MDLNALQLISLKNQVDQNTASLGENANQINKLNQQGYVDGIPEETGVGGYQFLDINGIYGWGSIVATGLTEILKFALKKDTTHPKTVTHDLTVRLFELTDNTGFYNNKTLIQEFIIPASSWNILTSGQEIICTLASPYSIVINKYYGVTIFCQDGINPLQVGKNAGSTSDRWYRGSYCNEATNSIYSPIDDYGLYFKLYPKNYVKFDNLQIPDVNKYNFFSMSHLMHFENPLVKNCPTFTGHWLKQDKDLYIVQTGDSIFAWQTTFTKADEGVTRVPPVCDRKGNAYLLWKNLIFGNPQYRRFDDGKNALVGSWDKRWLGLDSPFFTETGVFDTYYSSGTNGNNDYDNNLTKPELTTTITQRTCPITTFCEADNQRHIPKRISNTASASVSFTIPAGYKKFDFLYHTNLQGDDIVTITVVQGAGKVNVNPTKRDFTTPVDANNYVLSMLETNGLAVQGYDNGCLAKRLYFEKVNISDSITITLTKSTNTSKYLMYWGVTYWGTATEPNACHLDNTARGGYQLAALLWNKIYNIGIRNPDLIILEHTLINDSTTSTDPTSYLNVFTQLVTYINSLTPHEVFYVIPHIPTDKLSTLYYIFWNTIKAQMINLGYSYVDVSKSMYNMYLLLYPTQSISFTAFLATLMYDSVTHPNSDGFNIYNALMKPIFDLM